MKLTLKLILLVTLTISAISASQEAPTQSEVAKLYVATFNRAPDAGGLAYWVDDSGLKLSQIAQSFFDQPETQALYPPTTPNRDFINSVYQNLFNRVPDSAGWDYWENELNIGSFSKNRFIEAVINGAQDSEVSLDATILNNKNEVGLYFANNGLTNTDEAKRVMVGVTSNSLTVSFIKEKITANTIPSDVWDGFYNYMSSGGGGGSSDEEPIVEFSYPEDSDVLIHFKQTNGDAQGDYVLENEDGESEWSGTVDGVDFSITSIDDFPNEIVIGSSNATFTYNGDDTFNYEIYIDGELIEEEYSVALASLEPRSVARSIVRASNAQCTEKKQDIATMFKIFVSLAITDNKEYTAPFRTCVESSNDYIMCMERWSVKEIVLHYIMTTKPLAILLDDYKKSCLGTVTDEEEITCADDEELVDSECVKIEDDNDDSDNILYAYYKPTQSACENGGGFWNDSLDECRAEWNNAMNICELPSIEMWRAVITGCGGVLDDNAVDRENDAYQQCYEDLGYESTYYWSSTNYETITAGSWLVYFNDGSDGSGNNSYAAAVRCVR